MTGDEGEEQRVPPGVLRVSGVRAQVLCGGPVLPARQQGDDDDDDDDVNDDDDDNSDDSDDY